MKEIYELTASEVRNKILNKELSAYEVTKAVFERIEKTDELIGQKKKQLSTKNRDYIATISKQAKFLKRKFWILKGYATVKSPNTTISLKNTQNRSVGIGDYSQHKAT